MVEQHSSEEDQAQIILQDFAKKIALLPPEYQDLFTPEFTKLENQIVDIAQNIAERRRAEEALRESKAFLRQCEVFLHKSEERLHTLLTGVHSCATDRVVVVDEAFRVLAFNEAYFAACRTVYGADIQVGANLFEYLAPFPEAQARAMELFGRALRGESILLTEALGDTNRSRRYSELCFSPIQGTEGRILGAAHISREVTERVRMEKALRENEARLYALISANAQVFYCMNPDWTEMRQLNGGNFLADTVEPDHNWMQQYIHPDDQAWVWAVIQKAIHKETFFDLEHRVLRADGTIGWTASRAVPVQNAAGDIVEWFGAASDITERKQAEESIAQDLRDTRLLQELSTQLIPEENIDVLFDKLMQAAITLMHSDAGSMQVLAPERNELDLVRWQGFHPASAQFWQRVRANQASSCSVAMDSLERVIVPDVDRWVMLQGTEDLSHFRLSGIRAIQSTPLISRGGQVLGMISTHWRKPYQPTDWELRLFDILVRQAADLVERVQAEARLKTAADRDAYRVKLADALRPMADPEGIQIEANRVLGEHLQCDRCYYVEIDEEQREYVVARDWHRSGAEGHAFRYPLADWPMPWLLNGEPWVVCDVDADPAMPDDQRGSYRGNAIGACAVVPLVKGGQLVATMCVNHREPRDWSPDEVDMLQETAERTWDAVDRARAEVALRKSEATLRVSEEKYRNLFNSIDEGFCIIEVLFDEDESPIDYRFLEANPMFEEQTGIRNGIGRRMREIAPLHEERWFEIYGRIAKTGEALRFENPAQQLNSYYDVYAFRVGQPEERKVAILFKDISLQKRAEAELRESEGALRIANERFRASIDSLTESFVIYSAVRRDGEIVDLRYEYVNEEVCRQHQVTRDQLVGRTILEIIPVVKENGLFDKYVQVIETGQPLNGQQLITSDPTKATSQAHGVFDYRVSKFDDGIIITANDVTEWVRLEAERQEAIKEREIHHRLAQQRELERQSFSRELHDGPVQTLSSLMFILQSLKAMYPEPSLQVEIDQLRSSIKGAIQDLRQSMYELRPPSVIQFGLAKAIQAHNEHFRERNPQIHWDLELANDRQLLPEQICLALFRIYQEAVNNILLHSETDSAWVRYQILEDQVTLEIGDRGSGFPESLDVSHLIQNHHFGLAGIAERVQAINGELEILSQPGEGTVVKVKVPIANPMQGSS